MDILSSSRSQSASPFHLERFHDLRNNADLGLRHLPFPAFAERFVELTQSLCFLPVVLSEARKNLRLLDIAIFML